MLAFEPKEIIEKKSKNIDKGKGKQNKGKQRGEQKR